jgi:hypothetical protein
VIVRKNTGEIQMCVDFSDLKKASINDNYPLPNMAILLHQLIGSSCMSMLDGFSRYNQVLFVEKEREKTTFITPWGTYAYARMPFGLKNVLSLQENLLGCISEMPGNLIVFVIIYSIMGVKFDQDEYLNH